MSTSKFIMARKLAKVQEKLMSETITDMTFDGLLPLIFNACHEENMAFWFNFYEHEVVLNLRDIGHENYELNIRQYYETPLKTEDLEHYKCNVLINTFLITSGAHPQTEGMLLAQQEDPLELISSDKPMPSQVRDAINTLNAKGVEVTVESIRNHIPFSQLDNNQRIKCKNFLKKLEESG